MSKAKAPRVFVPLTKVDEAQRLVYGRITQEMLDKSKEVMDYDSSKPFFKQWSDEIHENSGGLSKGNVRVMHGLTAAGKLTELDFNDDDKAIDVCAKVVDDAEWNKVVEGVYTGFSVGGAYEKRWTDTVDGEKIKKFTAKPNEVSLVDNPCVPSATFSMFKADGSETSVMFKVENNDEEWPDFAKADDGEESTTAVEEPNKEPEQLELKLPTNDEVVAHAEKIAKAAGDGTTWMQHVEKAREELIKASTPKKDEAKKDNKAAAKDNSDPADDDQEEAGDAKATKADVRNDLKQVWSCTDNKTFEKKADAEAHEATLKKNEPTEVEKLKARLDKALSPEAKTEETPLMEDWDRLGKAIQALETPFEPEKLNKGMYTVSRFANTLWDLGSLVRKIAKEGVTEGDDNSDKTVSDGMKKAMGDLCTSFKAYVDNQVTELMAGMDDDVCVEVYDYYYAAATSDPENQLAKDVCSIITDRREPSREVRETMAKAWGVTDEAEDTGMNPDLQKRFTALETSNAEFKKIAEDAVGEVEKLTKRVEQIEETPLPRAPRNIAFREGDQEFLGKRVTNDTEKVAVLKEMMELHGADGLATMMIKASQATGGQKLSLNR